MLNKCNLFQTIISATQSRKKQQTELVRSVLYAEKDKKRKERENLPITSLPVEMLAAQEPSLSSAVMEDQDEDSDGELDRYVQLCKRAYRVFHNDCLKRKACTELNFLVTFLSLWKSN